MDEKMAVLKVCYWAENLVLLLAASMVLKWAVPLADSLEPCLVV